MWLILDLVFLVQAYRDPRFSRFGLAVVQLPIAASVAVAVMAGTPPTALDSLAFWFLTGAVNVLLALVGLHRQRLLAVVGLCLTPAALMLIALGSFASLLVMAAAAVLCVASALFPRKRR